MNKQPMIEIRNLEKFFSINSGLFNRNKKFVRAIDDVSLTIYKGEIVGLVGESGSGKTTLARVVLDLTKRTGGEVLIDGIDIEKASKAEIRKLRSEIAVVFQDPLSNLNPRETVESSIMRPMLIHGISKEQARKTAGEVLDMVKMDRSYLTSYPHQLSGGQLQRIAIARALALNPKIMVLDEPTSALDVSVQAQILNLLLDLQEQLGLTYLVITHDLNVIKYISDKIAVMYLGKLVEFGPVNEVAADPAHPYTRSLLTSAPILDPSLRVADKKILVGDPGKLSDVGVGCRFANRCPHAMDICRAKEPQKVALSENHWVACELFSEKGK